MPSFATEIAQEDVCPDLVVENTSTFPANTSHDITNFKEFARYSLLLPNGMTVYFRNDQYPNQVQPPNTSLSVAYQTCLIGKFTASYTALPTPPEEPVSGQAADYEQNENFYYNGVIYKVLNPTFEIPQLGIANGDLIQLALQAAAIDIIQESQIADKYKATENFFLFCNIRECLLDHLAKINCLIVKEPTRNDICEMSLYEEILQLNFIEYTVANKLSNPYISSEEEDYKIKSMSNYVNSICCCKKCNC